VLVLLGVGCGPAPQVRPYDPAKPIELEKEEFLQDGQIVEAGAVRKDLRNDPATKGHMRRSEIVYGSALVTSIVGGGLIGWYLGEVIAEQPDPAWEAGVIGGALVVTSIGLVIWSIGSQRQAVAAHNASLGRPKPAGAYYQLPNTPFIVGADSVGFAF
jgi:hypothetical protein